MNEITHVSYKNAPNRKEIKALYFSSFPKHEQMPWWLLRILQTQRGVDITGYYDENTFCGFTYTVAADDILFVLFFAVNQAIRGKGYGSAILDLLKEKHPDKTIFLNIEPLDENADNYDKRVRRFKFYEKSGFYDTGFNIDEVGGTFRVLASSPEIDEEKYLNIFKKLSYGLWKPRITKETIKGEK